MNVVDSSGWLEYFSGSVLARHYTKYLENKEELLVPTLVMHEVYRWIKAHRDEDEALKYVAKMNEGHVVALSDYSGPVCLDHFCYRLKIELLGSKVLGLSRLQSRVHKPRGFVVQ